MFNRYTTALLGYFIYGAAKATAKLLHRAIDSIIYTQKVRWQTRKENSFGSGLGAKKSQRSF